MKCSWQHPSFGRFECKDSYYFTTLNVPAFKRFSYDTGYSNAPRSTGDFRLSFGPGFLHEKWSEPTLDMVRLAERTLANPDKLVDAVAHSLWEEFNGRGPTVGIWWYGNLDAVNKSFDRANLPHPTQPEDVLAALQLRDIDVLTQLWEYPHPAVVLTFYAAFEEEHGVCVVVDGENVLGISFAGECELAK